MASFSISGLASSLPTDDIIAQLMSVEQQPIDRLKLRQAQINAQQAAMQEMNTRLSALRDKAGALANRNLYGGGSATSSDTSVVSVSGGDGAVAGTYQVTVQKLALAHQVRFDGFADTDTTRLGTGTLTLQVGAGTATTITVDSSNNTLGGLRDAINASAAGVTATIIDDGSAANGKRLILSSSITGTAGAITLSSNLSGGQALPAYQDLQAAQDAQVVLGSGAGAITITKSTNTISGIVPGATLTLQKESATPVSISVSQNQNDVVSAVRDFVDQYNQFHDFVAQETAWDPTTKKGGLLLGDYDTLAISDEVVSQITGVTQGLPSSLNQLSQVGITLDGKGVLQLDENALREKLASDPTGVQELFAAQGTASNDSLTFVSAGSNTKASQTPYSVQITQAATQARLTAGVAMPEATAARLTAGVAITGPLAADETLTVNGTAIALTAGMDGTAVLNAINAQSGLTGVTASLTDANGQGSGQFLTLTQNTLGDQATITAVSSQHNNTGAVTSGIGATEVTAAAASGESGGTGAAGTNDALAQAETLVINGASISLTQGMSQAQIIAAINTLSDKTGVVASATDASGSGSGRYLTLTQRAYGSTATITALSSQSNKGPTSSGLGVVQVSSSAPTGETGGTGSAGVDVAGTINGEDATGQGQFLTGKTGNATTEGLQIRYTGSGTGTVGTMSVTLGFGHTVKTLLNTITDPVSGRLKTLLDSYSTQSKEVGDEISDKEAALPDKEARLREKFARLEGAMSKLQTQGQRLSAQLAAFQSSNSNK